MDVKSVLKRHGYTQRKVAELLGVNEASISTCIRRGGMTATTLRRIADAIGADYSEFFEDEKPKSKKKSVEVVIPDNAIDGGIITLGGQQYRQLFVPITDVVLTTPDKAQELVSKTDYTLTH